MHDIYIDSYCVITDMQNGRALYADRHMDAQYMPIKWAQKMADYFTQGNFKQGYKLLDMVNNYWNQKRHQI